MKNRRHFLKQTGVFAIGSLVLPACGNNSTEKTTTDTTGAGANGTGRPLEAVGVQLWSVKDVLENDLPGTLKQLGEIGYKEIESYPGKDGHYYGKSPADFKKMLADAGLTLVSSHVGSGAKNSKAANWQQATLVSRFEELVEKAAETGQQYLTCSWTDESLRSDLKGLAQLFNQSGEACKKAGLQFAYHNHDFEFKKQGNDMLYDYVLANTDPELVKFEMDMYWVVRAGYDPSQYLLKYPNRFPLGHVKDMDKNNKENNTELGKGSIDYNALLPIARQQGMQHFIVEQETFTGPSIEAMKENYQYLAQVKV